ncbi:MAG: hypothetical protein HY053_08200 [Proteobacteria bacterium]|nr:hypothetical protein [Pseudomonadota bacterium]
MAASFRFLRVLPVMALAAAGGVQAQPTTQKEKPTVMYVGFLQDSSNPGNKYKVITKTVFTGSNAKPDQEEFAIEGLKKGEMKEATGDFSALAKEMAAANSQPHCSAYMAGSGMVDDKDVIAVGPRRQEVAKNFFIRIYGQRAAAEWSQPKCTPNG